MQDLIIPHGGKLVNRILEGEERKKFLKRAKYLKSIQLNSREVSDLEMITIGAFSPLEGFLYKEDYERVVEDCSLKNGII